MKDQIIFKTAVYEPTFLTCYSNTFNCIEKQLFEVEFLIFKHYCILSKYLKNRQQSNSMGYIIKQSITHVLLLFIPKHEEITLSVKTMKIKRLTSHYL